MDLSSPDFQNNGTIPSEFTCDGKKYNPNLEIKNVPPGAKSLVLIVDDPDAPGKTFVHWLVFNIAPTTIKIAKNSIPGKEGINDGRKRGYFPPAPPSGTHRYFFKLYALDAELNLPDGVTKDKLEIAMQGHVIGKAELIGLYKRSG
jgi:Raf kinase inhibitor-like YbhB/YbcL family protein